MNTNNKKCIVTLLIGEKYQERWRTYYKDSWDKYAKIHGYDIIVVDDYLDQTERAKSRSPHWQKLLITEDERVKRYESVVWMDSDILINFHEAPCIVDSHANKHKIGVVSIKQTNSLPERRKNREERFYRYINKHGEEKRRGVGSIADIYKNAGLTDTIIDDYFNAGVMVLSPKDHAHILREVYDTYEENKKSAYENYPLCYHLFKNNHLDFIDRRFNTIWPHEVMEHYPFIQAFHDNEEMARTKVPDYEEVIRLCVNTAWHNSFFLHLINDKGMEKHMRLIDQSNPNPFAF
jgi:hypothetical protein